MTGAAMKRGLPVAAPCDDKPVCVGRCSCQVLVFDVIIGMLAAVTGLSRLVSCGKSNLSLAAPENYSCFEARLFVKHSC